VEDRDSETTMISSENRIERPDEDAEITVIEAGDSEHPGLSRMSR